MENKNVIYGINGPDVYKRQVSKSKNCTLRMNSNVKQKSEKRHTPPV